MSSPNSEDEIILDLEGNTDTTEQPLNRLRRKAAVQVMDVVPTVTQPTKTKQTTTAQGSDDTSSSSSSSEEEDDTGPPAVISQTAFLAQMRQYLKANCDNVEAARATGSGWEIWLQVELCMYMRRTMSADIVREADYQAKTTLRCDFLLNSKQPDGKSRMLVEIKTNTAREDVNAFVLRVADDFEKQLEATGTATLVVGVWVGADPVKATHGEVINLIEVVRGRLYCLQAGIA
jgi:hypothetical protein